MAFKFVGYNWEVGGRGGCYVSVLVRYKSILMRAVHFTLFYCPDLKKIELAIVRVFPKKIEGVYKVKISQNS